MSFLEHYFRYYEGLSAPGYAVFVTGEWGVGKTYQVKATLSKIANGPTQNDKAAPPYYYLSLFGADSADGVHDAVLAAMDPNRTRYKTVLKGMESLFSSSGRTLSGAAVRLINSQIKQQKDADRTLIFDDLERSSLELDDILGVINYYVEHAGFRVIVIAHDKRIDAEFGVRQEKVFGQRIRVEPQTLPAFNTFVSSVLTHRGTAKRFVLKYKTEILSQFLQDNSLSLRILKHVVEDAARLHDSLTPKIRENKAGMRDLVEFFCKANIGFRVGSINAREGIKGEAWRQSVNRSSMRSTVVGDIEYPPILLDTTLKAMLVDGVYDKQEIRRDILNSKFFVSEKDPAWKRVLAFHENPEVADAALEELIAQFKSRNIYDAATLLHGTAIQLVTSEGGTADHRFERLLSEAKELVDWLYENGRLPLEGDLWAVQVWTNSSAIDGYGFWTSPHTAEVFSNFRTYLDEKNNQVFQERISEKADEILADLIANPETWVEDFVKLEGGPEHYNAQAILHCLDEEQFLAAWSNLNHNLSVKLAETLAVRFRALEDERAWIARVRDDLEVLAASKPVMRRLVLKDAIEAFDGSKK